MATDYFDAYPLAYFSNCTSSSSSGLVLVVVAVGGGGDGGIFQN